MMMRRYIAAAFAVAFVVAMGLWDYAQAPGTDFKQTKEWKALDRYVGTWDDQITVTIPERKQGRGTNTAAWTLGDRFLQMKSKMDDNSESMHMFTYDSKRQALRYWWFSSAGDASVATGSWDEASRTFNFKAEDAGPTSIIMSDRFIDDDHHEWKVTVKDADGKVVYEMSGKPARRKLPAEKP